MNLCWFATFEAVGSEDPQLDCDDATALCALLRATPALADARVHLPTVTHDPMLHDGAPPALVLQLYFEHIEDLEAALAPDGYLQSLALQAAAVKLRGHRATQQAMLVRRFAVDRSPARRTSGRPETTYQVTYEGPPQDLNAWLSHYLRGHAPLMAQLPGVREVEVYTRIDWCGFLPWPRANHMQRNQVVFDSPAALEAALQSPLRAQMREHFDLLPPFSGSTTHFPMVSFSAGP